MFPKVYQDTLKVFDWLEIHEQFVNCLEIHEQFINCLCQESSALHPWFCSQ